MHLDASNTSSSINTANVHVEPSVSCVGSHTRAEMETRKTQRNNYDKLLNAQLRGLDKYGFEIDRLSCRECRR